MLDFLDGCNVVRAVWGGFMIGAGGVSTLFLLLFCFEQLAIHAGNWSLHKGIDKDDCSTCVEKKAEASEAKE